MTSAKDGVRQPAEGKCRQRAAANLPGDFKPLLWLLMRYIRLTPSYAATIALSILLPALGSGPFWLETAGSLGPTCRSNWWLNLLYVNNFIETDKLCLIHSWYLSNDWQFFTLSLILFATFYKSRRLTLLLIASLIAGSSAATFAITVANEFPPTIVTTSPAVAERWLFIHSLYYKPWPHLPSYLVGLLAGYLILRKESIKLSSTGRNLAWLLSTLLAFALLNSIYPWNMGLQVEPLISGLHSATFRTLWAICCAWFVFALSTRPQNPISKFLSWHGFQITSRLTYCTYLVHPLIIYYHFGCLRERIDSSIYGQFHRFIATLGLSYLFALLLSLLVESPSIQLQHFLSNLANNEHQDQKAKRTSESSTSNSWLGEQALGSGSSLMARTGSFRLLSGDCSGQLDGRPSGLAANKPGFCEHSLEEGEGCEVSRQVVAGSEAKAAAADADFQRKLAQAISRGFRIRSRIANSNTIAAKHKDGTAKVAQLQSQAFRGPLAPSDRLGTSSGAQSDSSPKSTRRQPVGFKRGEVSTFVSATSSSGARSQMPEIKWEPSNDLRAKMEPQSAKTSRHQLAANLNELILTKQKPMAKSHGQFV